MWLNKDILEVGKIDRASEEYIKSILKYDWQSSKHEAGLGDTKSIYLPFKDGHFDQFEDIEKKDSHIILNTVPFLKIIQDLYPRCKFIKCEIYMCPPKTEQPFHVDPRILHRFSHRIHWPIATNNRCFLQIEDRTYHLKPNILYEFNNMLAHRSYNHGSSNRIHMVVDIMDEDYFNALKEVDYFLNSTDPGTNLVNYLKTLTE